MSAEKIGLYLAGLFAAVVAYHKGYMAAMQEVKANNAKKQAQYVKIQEKADHISTIELADELQDGTRRF
jgi:hypothetical protein